jgi:hypothetical protein
LPKESEILSRKSVERIAANLNERGCHGYASDVLAHDEALRAQVAVLTEERERWKKNLTDTAVYWMGRARAAEAGIRRYGKHDFACAIYESRGCNCGFVALLGGTEPATVPEPSDEARAVRAAQLRAMALIDEAGGEPAAAPDPSRVDEVLRGVVPECGPFAATPGVIRGEDELGEWEFLPHAPEPVTYYKHQVAPGVWVRFGVKGDHSEPGEYEATDFEVITEERSERMRAEDEIYNEMDRRERNSAWPDGETTE